MNTKQLFIFLGLFILFSSCCLTIKEEHLGNNLYLSEYDKVDRRILYSEKRCTGTGVVIVPMTVLEYGYNTNWIIAKSGDGRTNSNIQYWIIKNDYDFKPDADIIKANMIETFDMVTFNAELKSNKIKLELKKIK